MVFACRAFAGACALALGFAVHPHVAHAYGDVDVLVEYGAAQDDDVTFGTGAQMASASVSPPGVGVSATAYAQPPDGAPLGEVGGSVQFDVAAGTPFSFAAGDRWGGAGEAFRSDVWLPVLPGQDGDPVSITLHVHAMGSGETRADPTAIGALGSNVLIEGGIFEAFGPGFVDAFTAEAQLGYFALPPPLTPGFAPPFYDGEWTGGADWTVTTDPVANLQTFSYETWIDLPFVWTAGTALEVTLFTQYFGGWCCGNVDVTLGADLHASLSHTLQYELESASPGLQFVLIPEPSSGGLVALGLAALALGHRRPRPRDREGQPRALLRRPRESLAARTRRSVDRVGPAPPRPRGSFLPRSPDARGRTRPRHGARVPRARRTAAPRRSRPAPKRPVALRRRVRSVVRTGRATAGGGPGRPGGARATPGSGSSRPSRARR